LGGRHPELPLAFVRVDPQPDKSGADFSSTGNLAKMKFVGPNHVEVFNDSCSDFYLRLYVEASPFPPASDGGSPVADDAGNATPDAGDAK
jgi:hypothetical protein